MDASTQQLTSALLTDKDELDRSALPELLKQTEAVVRYVCADGAYDFEYCYRAIKHREAKPLIPLRSDAVERDKSPFEERYENVRKIRSRGRPKCKRISCYHNCSLVETAFFRLKTIFSDKLASRASERQKTEARG